MTWMLTWLATQRTTIQPIENPIPEKYRPGNVVNNLRCEFSHWQEDEPLECYRDNLYFSWDYRSSITRHTGAMVDPRPIGDYMLAWGTPIGQIDMSVCRYVYWNVQGEVVYVLVCGKIFGPDTPVTYVIMSEVTGPLQKWSGFTNK